MSETLKQIGKQLLIFTATFLTIMVLAALEM